MNLIDRAKNILFKPREEWVLISRETTSVSQLVTNYLLIMAIIPAAAQFIRYGLIGHNIPFYGHVAGSISWGLKQAVVSYISNIAGVFLSAFIIDILATNFASQKNFTRAMQLVVFSYTAAFVAGIFYLIPGLGILAVLGSLYGLYLLFLGLKPMMQTPDDKVAVYFILSLLVIIVVSVILSFILGKILLAGAEINPAAVGIPGF
ncbi:MAG: YIP1 family protein [Bacteroidales bacterium]|nr:YIP1 family protein [Bacteroidales bacterium]